MDFIRVMVRRKILYRSLIDSITKASKMVDSFQKKKKKEPHNIFQKVLKTVVVSYCALIFLLTSSDISECTCFAFFSRFFVHCFYGGNYLECYDQTSVNK